MGLETSLSNKHFNIFFDVPEQYLHMGKQLFFKTIVDIRIYMDWRAYNGKEFSIYDDIMNKIKQLNIKPIFSKEFNSVFDLVIHEAEWKNLNDYLESMLANGITSFHDYKHKHVSLCAFDNTCFTYWWRKPQLI